MSGSLIQVKDPSSLSLGVELRGKLRTTTDAVLRVSGHQTLHENNPRMLKMMGTRNPYVDPLNLIQVASELHRIAVGIYIYLSCPVYRVLTLPCIVLI